jgi:vacuolar-type H+-ATPase subunit H
VDSKKKNEEFLGHLAVIQQIEKAETELTRLVTEARQAAEDRLLQAQKDASFRIQLEHEEARQKRRELVRTEMEIAESEATQEIKDAEIKAKKYYAKGSRFISKAVDDALGIILSEEGQE